MTDTYNFSVYNTVSGVALSTFEVTCAIIPVVAGIPVAISACQLNHLSIDKAVLSSGITAGLAISRAAVIV